MHPIKRITLFPFKQAIHPQPPHRRDIAKKIILYIIPQNSITVRHYRSKIIITSLQLNEIIKHCDRSIQLYDLYIYLRLKANQYRYQTKYNHGEYYIGDISYNFNFIVRHDYRDPFVLFPNFLEKLLEFHEALFVYI